MRVFRATIPGLRKGLLWERVGVRVFRATIPGFRKALLAEQDWGEGRRRSRVNGTHHRLDADHT